VLLSQSLSHRHLVREDRVSLAYEIALTQVPRVEPNLVRFVVAAAGIGMSDRKHSNPTHHGEKPGSDKPASKAVAKQPFSFRYFLKALGPGLITGASDDDPSGIGIYSQAGAQLGYGIGWTMLLGFPLMAAIQEISARVGRATGQGISGNGAGIIRRGCSISWWRCCSSPTRSISPPILRRWFRGFCGSPVSYSLPVEEVRPLRCG
jgi:hypothetical protein